MLEVLHAVAATANEADDSGHVIQRALEHVCQHHDENRHGVETQGRENSTQSLKPRARADEHRPAHYLGSACSPAR